MTGRFDGSSPAAVAMLVGANLVPVVGVLLWGWSVAEILALYWVENGVATLFLLPKLLLAEGEIDPERIPGASSPDEADTALSTVLIIVFVVPGAVLFWVVHGAFVLLLARQFSTSFLSALSAVRPAIAALFLSHTVSFVVGYVLREGHENVSTVELAMNSERRTLTLHAVVFLGGVAISSLWDGAALVVLLVVLKTGYDLDRLLEEGRPTGAGAA